MHKDTVAYNKTLSATEAPIARLLAETIDAVLPKAENKIWHRHPVWFPGWQSGGGNTSKLKAGIRLLFWSGQSFDEPGLTPGRQFQSPPK